MGITASRLGPVVVLLALLLVGAPSCGGVAACVGWWCVGYIPPGPCWPYCKFQPNLAGGDFDGDGKADLASAGPEESAISIRRGDGTGGFADAAPVPGTTGEGVDFLRTGRFNADAHADLVALDLVAGEVRAYLGDGSGAFPVAGAPALLPGLPPVRRMTVGPVDGDAYDDLVLFDLEGGVTVLLADGAGSFALAPAGRVELGRGAVDLAVGDLDGDGRLDVVVADAFAGTLQCRRGDGAGGFAPTGAAHALRGLPTQVALGELDGAPGLDVAVLAGDVPALQVFFGNGDATLTASPQGEIAVPLASASQLHVLPSALTPGGPADLLVLGVQDDGTGAFVGFPNAGDGTLGTAGTPVGVEDVEDVLVLDLNGDAHMDLVFSAFHGTSVGVGLGGTRGG